VDFDLTPDWPPEVDPHDLSPLHHLLKTVQEGQAQITTPIQTLAAESKEAAPTKSPATVIDLVSGMTMTTMTTVAQPGRLHEQIPDRHAEVTMRV